jgi:hypothetical protein
VIGGLRAVIAGPYATRVRELQHVRMYLSRVREFLRFLLMATFSILRNLKSHLADASRSVQAR